MNNSHTYLTEPEDPLYKRKPKKKITMQDTFTLSQLE